MKLLLLSTTFLFIALTINAQVKNVNPDKNGIPWFVGGLRVPSIEEINRIPVISQSFKNSKDELPSSLDNTKKKYFRPVFSQIGGSCAQASGIAYTFTYEINRNRHTSANEQANQFPSHYTYNFLNNGSDTVGSFFVDGWNIIKANGCPTIATYGGLTHNYDDTYWMADYSKYEQSIPYRVKNYFTIDVSTPDGLETLKHWMYDHLDGSSDGSIVNFAAGISNEGYNMSYDDNKIISWGYSVNHAMTFVGWDDTVSYDYNNDGEITNNKDINNDGVVDMRDWEKGALIMINSWGDYWGNEGKAYVMYKLLAEPTETGGIFANKVFGINVEEAFEPQLKMKVKIKHSSRKLIKISAGISSDVNDTTPEHYIDFPLFSYQGGDFPMRGEGVSNPISIVLDITPLLNYINSGETAKFFLSVTEKDTNNYATGQIYDFIVEDNSNNEYECSAHNVEIKDNTKTLMSVIASVNFNSPEITTTSLPDGESGKNYSYQLTASEGSTPYQWKVIQKYNQNTISETFPEINTEHLTPTDNDDGYANKTINFDFPFYGQGYNQLYITTDGTIIFEPSFNYIRTESAIKSNKVISVFASDLMLFPDSEDGIFYEGDNSHATFRWKISLFENESANIDVAVTLYPDGKIKFFYNNIEQGIEWVSGISSGTGSYLISSISGMANPSNLSLKMTPAPYPIGLSISSDGILQGTCPNEINTWNLDFVVTDRNNISKTKTLGFTTIPASLIDMNKNREELICYPNPFNKQVNISYIIDNNTFVDLSIYDISGKQVENIIHKHQKTGDYSIIWEPVVDKGIYFYRLKTNKGIKTGKLIFE